MEELLNIAQPAVQYLSNIQSSLLPGTYSTPESFILLPQDTAHLAEIDRVVQRHQGSAGVVLFGVGGSSLGARALIAASSSTVPVWYAETFDPFFLEQLKQVIQKSAEEQKHLTYIIASKSGTTLETLINFSAVSDDIKSHDPKWNEHTIVITHEESPLAQYAKKEGIDFVFVPAEVGGRFSVFSATSLIPAALAGIDIQELCAGAVEARETFLSEDLEKNYALAGAAAGYAQMQTGKGIHALFVEGPVLRGLTMWWQQLLSESLGKQGVGVTPLPVIGSGDVHTTGQLLLDGPNTFFTSFLNVEVLPRVSAGNHEFLDSSVAGKDVGDLSHAVMKGIQQAFAVKERPYISYSLSDLSPRSLGECLMGFMMQTIFMAKLMDVHAFDQPALELYKEEIKKLL